MQSETNSVRPFIVLWTMYTALIFGVAAAVWIPTGLYKKMDFRAMYSGGKLARTDPAHLYDLSRQKELEDTIEPSQQTLPFAHLPYDVLIYLPLSFLNYRQAYFAMIALNALLIFGCFLAAREEFSTTIPGWQPRPGLIFFALIPTSIALAQGQDALAILLVLCLTWRFLKREQHFVAGLVLANMLVKPHLALLVAFFIAVRYGWRFVAGFATGAIAVVLISVPWLRNGGWREMLHVYSGMSLVSGNSNAQEAALGVFSWGIPNLRGMVLITLGHSLSSHALFLLVVSITAVMVLWGAIAVKRLPPRTAFAVTLVLTVLASYHIEPYDLAILLLPLVMMDASDSVALARCRDLVLALPIALLIFMPSSIPGAGFALMSFPLVVWAVLLGRQAYARTPSRVAVTA